MEHVFILFNLPPNKDVLAKVHQIKIAGKTFLKARLFRKECIIPVENANADPDAPFRMQIEKKVMNQNK